MLDTPSINNSTLSATVPDPTTDYFIVNFGPSHPTTPRNESGLTYLDLPLHATLLRPFVDLPRLRFLHRSTLLERRRRLWWERGHALLERRAAPVRVGVLDFPRVRVVQWLVGGWGDGLSGEGARAGR
jgi:hypothetical protein